MAQLKKEVQFLCTRPVFTATSYAPTDGSYGMYKYIKADYVPLTTVYFEVVMSCTFTGTPNSVGVVYAQLYNSSTSAAVSGSEVTVLAGGGTVFDRVRSGDLTSALGASDTYYVQVKTANASTTTGQIRSAKLVTYQNGTITKTKTTWLIGGDDSKKGTAYAEVTERKRMYFLSTDYQGLFAESYRFGATIKGTAGSQGRARVFDVDNAAARSTVTTTSTTEVYQTGFFSEFNVVVSAEHTCEYSSNSATNTAFIRNAHFEMLESAAGGITKTVDPIQVWQSEFSTTLTTYAVGEFKEANFNPNDYTSMSVDSTHESSIKTGVGTTASAIIKDDATQITGSEVTTTDTAYTRATSGSLTEPTDSSDIDFDLKHSTGGSSAFLCNARMIVYLTNITYGAIRDVIGHGIIPYKR
jgi:hypothetical protein